MSTADNSQGNDKAEKLDWTGIAGQKWAAAQPLIEQTIKAFEDVIVEGVRASSGGAVMEVGCGAGGVALALARALDGKGALTGVDISQHMLTAAKARAEAEDVDIEFLLADAQTYAFQPESFDRIVSRFGVMFFEDFIEAFANLRRAAKKNAVLHCVAWRSAEENPFMTTAERAAAPFLENIPPRDPDAPGQFAFADDKRVRAFLEAAGWSAIDIQPLDRDCVFPKEKLDEYFLQLGPVSRVIDEADEETRTKVIEVVRPAFDRFVDGDEVRFNGACWNINAVAP
ncbi:MAG: class I SAM-dependent methyltransferase [Pseudomonadota bacterium]